MLILVSVDNTATRFHLVDLLAVKRLGLRMVTEADPETPILGAHAIEIDHPARWMKPGWLMLTTGARFTGVEGSALLQRELVDELVTAGVAALAFGTGISRETVPEMLVEQAARRGLPLLSVPLETPFLEIIDVVSKATLTKDVYLQRRTVHIQDYLLESLTESDALAALVHRLADLLRSTVVLYDQSGTILASSGLGPTQIIRTEIASKPNTRNRFTVGRWQVLTDPVRTDTTLHWLALASRRASVSEELAEPAMEAARRLVTMIVRSREAVRTEDRLRRARLLRMILGGDRGDGPYIWDRLETHGFRRNEPVRLLLAESGPLGSGGAADRIAAAEKLALDTETRLVLGVHEEHIVGVLPAEQSPPLPWLAELPSRVHCGISEPFADLAEGPKRLREAELGLRAARRQDREQLCFEDIGLLDWLVAAREPETVRAKVTELLRPLTEHQALFAALTEYIRSEGDIRRTARTLGLHPNSVRYRLKRASMVTGYDLTAATELAELAVAIRLLEE
ncbi:PucR family transcriptional regulator [Sciscionella marina]|uniref:PucR family transcriptional regulator n=1 Tax=Sciscionella marina TaxID=508770 RepID=UPI00039A07A5|nr:PucR family transcriptional regulator [Sciscionella marina]